MMIHFWIPGPLRSMTGGRDRVDVETSGGTLRDALEALFAAHPGIRDRVLTERGEIREKVKRAQPADWRRPWRTACRFPSFQPSAAADFFFDNLHCRVYAAEAPTSDIEGKMHVLRIAQYLAIAIAVAILTQLLGRSRSA